ncbi:hypothetical protein F3Y22_tig00111273pilonHSYRG00360 [Hibiscus syriacus]|uniref:Uncharacterized protein n=1 Tax=Hibiscus syriacus TaxID=106335 RepID=A0A6A2YSZ9_HIBSY|nr:hypothetical protein F3Y22_tig00111273pilonHSYRG00360 [Hibiscus syriacus]
MATSNKTHKYSQFITALLVFSFSSISLSSRLLGGNPSAAQPTLNLGLPVSVEGSDKPDQDPKSTALPCDHHKVQFKNFEVGVLRSPTQKLAGKYGPMYLSMLPKGGKVPSSGPSKGSNDIET